MVTGKKTDLEGFLKAQSSLSELSLSLISGEKDVRLQVNHAQQESPLAYFRFDAQHEGLEDLSPFESIGKDFSQIDIHFSSREVSLLPNGLFDSETAQHGMELLFGPRRACEVLHSYLDSVEAYTFYRVSHPRKAQIDRLFPQAKYHHILDTLILKTWQDCQFKGDVLFRLHQEGDYLFVLVFSGRKLVLSNNFLITEDPDMIYHVVHVIQAMEQDHDKARIQCSGTLLNRLESMALIESYCPLTESLPGPSGRIEEYILDMHGLCVS